MSITPHVVIVAGPTAAGKSALGMAIAEEFGGVIINADSQQRYADLRILTSRPSEADEARVPHRLFGDLQSSDSGSAAEWAIKASREIGIATAAGKLPILVGGTGLYFRALMEGLSDMPAVSNDVRVAAAALREEIGAAVFHARLAERDPLSAARLNPGDTHRVLRAWEVVEGTGRPLSTWQRIPGTPPLNAAYFGIVVLPPREQIYAACDTRLVHMVETGALDEVKKLLGGGVNPDSGAAKAIGVPDLVAYLRGERGFSEALTLAQTATRQYAKRQMTWFRNQFNANLTVSEKLSESLIEIIFPNIRRFLLT